MEWKISGRSGGGWISRSLGLFLIGFSLATTGCWGDGSNSGGFTPAQNPVPAINSLSPSSATAGSSALTLSVAGSGFVSNSLIQWNGVAQTTTFVSSSQLTMEIGAADLATPGSAQVTVLNPAPGGGTSNGLTFTITEESTPSSNPDAVTIAPDGSAANGPSINGGMDWEGRYVVFASKASNLVSGDTNDSYDVFVRDTCAYVTGACVPHTDRVVTAAGGAEPNGDNGATAASPERSLAVSFSGRYVAFVSSASNLVSGDTNGVDDVYLSDTCIRFDGLIPGCVPQTVRVSLRTDGSEPTGPSSSPAVADDGRYVAFVSADSGLVAGDTNGIADVFLRDTCLNAGAGCTPTTTRISVASGGGDADGPSTSPAFTGRYLAFTSAAGNLVAGDTNGTADVFLRDTCIGATDPCTPATERISLSATGQQASGASSEPLVGPPMIGSDGYDYEGRFVVFVSSAENLVAGDTNGVADVFMRDTCRGRSACTPTTIRVSVTDTGSQILGQPSNSPGFLRWDGGVVAFVTAADGVVSGDTNGVADVFVRRVCHEYAPCTGSTTRASMGIDGAQANGASYTPRMNHDLFGAWVVTYGSDATNLTADPVPSPYFGGIFRTVVY